MIDYNFGDFEYVHTRCKELAKEKSHLEIPILLAEELAELIHPLMKYMRYINEDITMLDGIDQLDEELYEKHKSCTNFDYIKNSIFDEKNKKRGYDYEKSYFINRVEDFYFSVNEIPSMKWLTDLEKDLVDISFFLNNSDFISRVFRDRETGKLNNYGRLLLKYSRVPKV